VSWGNHKRPLNTRQQKFVEQYLITGMVSQAAIRAGYSPASAWSAGSRLRRLPKVAYAIRVGRANEARRAQIAHERVLLELGRVAFSDIGEVLDWTSDEDIRLRPKDQISPHQRAAIAELAPRRYGKGPRIKFHNKGRALETLAHLLGVNDKLVPAADPARMLRERQANHEKIMRRINEIVEERIAERCKAGKLIVVESSPNAGAPLGVAAPAGDGVSSVMPGRSAGHPRLQDMDGRDKPGHDDGPEPSPSSEATEG